MKTWKVKGRHELKGIVSGDIYRIEEENKKYYYLINILNPNDIYMIKEPEMYKATMIDKESLPAELLEFHNQRMEMKNKQNLSEEQIRNEIQRKKTQKEEDELYKRFVYSKQATKYLLEQGIDYSDVRLEYIENHIAIYTLDEKWEFKVIRDKITKKESYELIDVEEKKAEYKKRVNNLYNKTHMPKNICGIFANKFSEEDAIKVMNQLREDKRSVHDDPEKLYYVNDEFNYVCYLERVTGVNTIWQLSGKKRNKLYQFVFISN